MICGSLNLHECLRVVFEEEEMLFVTADDLVDFRGQNIRLWVEGVSTAMTSVGDRDRAALGSVGAFVVDFPFFGLKDRPAVPRALDEIEWCEGCVRYVRLVMAGGEVCRELPFGSFVALVEGRVAIWTSRDDALVSGTVAGCGPQLSCEWDD